MATRRCFNVEQGTGFAVVAKSLPPAASAAEWRVAGAAGRSLPESGRKTGRDRQTTSSEGRREPRAAWATAAWSALVCRQRSSPRRREVRCPRLHRHFAPVPCAKGPMRDARSGSSSAFSGASVAQDGHPKAASRRVPLVRRARGRANTPPRSGGASSPRRPGTGTEPLLPRRKLPSPGTPSRPTGAKPSSWPLASARQETVPRQVRQSGFVPDAQDRRNSRKRSPRQIAAKSCRYRLPMNAALSEPNKAQHGATSPFARTKKYSHGCTQSASPTHRLSRTSGVATSVAPGLPPPHPWQPPCRTTPRGES